MFMKINKVLILNKIKEYYSFKKDVELARFLDIKPQTLATWYARNTFDIELLYSKCEDIDGNFILSGKGNIHRSKDSEVNTITKNDEIDTVESKTIQENESLKETNQLLRFKIEVLEERLSKAKVDPPDSTVHQTLASTKPELAGKGSNKR